jgi:phosphonate transport system substrate-binding protein
MPAGGQAFRLSPGLHLAGLPECRKKCISLSSSVDFSAEFRYALKKRITIMRFPLLLNFLAVLALSICPGSRTSAADERPLSVAVTPVLIEKNVEVNDRLIRYIGEKMNMQIRTVQRKTYQEINDLMRQKEVDIAFICSLSYIVGKEKAGMELLVVPKTKGQPLYYSYVIVAKGGLARSIEDLRGQLYAYPDPLSNSGYLYPRYRLAKAGYNPDEFFTKWIITQSHSASIEAVNDGFVQGASVDSYIYDLMSILNPELTNNTKIIETSPAFGFPPVVIRKSLPEDMKKKLRTVFLQMEKDRVGGKILQDMLLDGFMQSDDSLFDSVRKMYLFMNNRSSGAPQ